MKLEDVFKTGDYLEYRNFRITELDKSFLRNLLSQEKGIRRIKNLLRTAGYLPKDLLQPILKSGIDFKDPSSPKRWIHHIIRLFGEENVQEELFNFIRGGSHKEVMNSLTTMYFLSPSIRTFKRGGHKRVVEVKWKWNKTHYEELINENVAEDQIKQSHKFKKRRIDFFINEFDKSENLVVKYYLGLHLRAYDNWPYTESQLAVKVLNEINKEEFPKNQDALKAAIKGIEKLEDYYYLT